MKKLTTGPLKAKSASLIVALGVLVGISIDRLAVDQRIGLGFAAAGLILVACVWAISRRRRPEVTLLLAGAAVLVCWAAVRTAEYLLAIDTLAALALVAIAATAAAFDPRVWLLGPFEHLRSVIDQGVALLAGATRPLAVLVESRSRADLGPAKPYLRGLLLALPVFIVFALLLASADAVFSDFISGLFPDLEISLDGTFGHILLVALLAWLAAGYFSFAWTPPHATDGNARASTPAERPDRFVELIVVLGSVTALFALFVVFQFAYFFGGGDQVVAGGTTYAEYAREGFFQLLAVSTLTAALIWFALQRLGRQSGRRQTIFRVVCTLMVLLTGVILVSALKRLGLYEEAYGYTRLRLLSHAFTFLVAGVLALILAQLWSRREGLVPAGAIALGFLVLFGLNAINPDAYIADRNLSRFDPRSAEPDISYVTQLSADAVPTALKHIERLTPRQDWQIRVWACELTRDPRGAREWNLGASRAHEAARCFRFSP
jgi:hypothetical protein